MINSLELKNFRNHENVRINNFCDGINVISGKNGEGKTNILEAIYMLTSGRSFRTIHDLPIINENASFAYANLEFKSKVSHKIELLIEKHEKKCIKIDGNNVRQMSEIVSCIPTVIFSPEDIKIIKEGPSVRRRYIDTEICRLRPTYIETLKKHKYICMQKNKALKSKDAEKLIEIYNDQFIKTSNIIFNNREKYLKKAIKTANNLLEDMGKKIKISGRQITDIVNGNTEENIREKLEKIKKRELEEKICLFGPQRTDIELLMNGNDTRDFASQGEAGTLAIALKFAASEIIENTLFLKPVMLLDDVFSYLDNQRKVWVLKKSETMQTFITFASDNPNELPGQKKYFIKNGQIYTQK